ncbi:hypothetical protein CRE_06211 [Caenorhabditis remanei]|uniref:DUF7154 domain-containing protein n=1 Tax=Caenorhabditis remanei TaxID=31234 RepID=E3NP23_CAERE|nr:hypothetical protein CRE_06211 [Caenorhabditis remanei]
MVYYTKKYTSLANVRFDTKQEEEIEYHSDWRSFNASIYSHQPKPSLGYGDKTTGSNLCNILKVGTIPPHILFNYMTFQKFLNNGKVSLCGAQVLVLAKRYPDESDVSDIISQLRANHVMVRIAVDSIPSGGSNSASLYEMSYQTNGYCAFATGQDLEIAFAYMTEIFRRPYQFIAQNFVVSGSGRIEKPAFEIPASDGFINWCKFAITVQNHTLDNSFVSMNYTIERTDGTHVYEYPSDYSHHLSGTAQTDEFYCNSSLSYKWTMDYHYNTNEQQIIQLRMYNLFYHDFLPLPPFE